MEEVVCAARTNDLTSLRRLVDKSNRNLLDIQSDEGKTPITFAVESNSIECVQWLIENGCRLSKKLTPPPSPEDCQEADGTDSFYPPLLAAVAFHSTQLATLLLNSGRVDLEDAYRGTTALIRACTEGFTDLVSLLISHGAKVNGWVENSCCYPCRCQHADPNVWEYRPLYYAVQHGHGDVVEVLVEKGAAYIAHSPIPCYSFWQPHSWSSADNNILQRCWGSVLELAVLRCKNKVELLLDRFQQDVSTLEAFQTLVQCVVAEDPKLTEILLDACLNRTAADSQDGKPRSCSSGSFWTVLKLAVRKCREGKEDIPLLLLQRLGPGVDDTSLLILLDLAVLRNLPLVVTQLLELLRAGGGKEGEEGDVMRGVRLQDVAYTALSQGNLPIIQQLVHAGLMHLQHTPAMLFPVLSAHTSCSDIGKLLRWLVEDQGCDPRAPNEYGLQLVHAAVKEQLVEAVGALCTLGVDANTRAEAEDELSPLQMHLNLCVLQLGVSPNVRLMEMLLEHGADLAMPNRQGYTPLALLFWLALARRRGSLDQRAALSTAYRPADVSSMKYFPLNAAFVMNSHSESSERQSLSSSSEEGSSASDDDDDNDDDSEEDWDSEDSEEESAVSSSGSRADRDSDDLLPPLLQAKEPQRLFIKRVVAKFGLGLRAMGADMLMGRQRWPRMARYLLLAGISSSHVPSLKDLCWSAVRRRLGGLHFQHRLHQLPLPAVMKDFLKTI